MFTSPVHTAKKNLTISGEVLVFALPIFTARAIYRPGVATVRWTIAARMLK